MVSAWKVNKKKEEPEVFVVQVKQDFFFEGMQDSVKTAYEGRICLSITDTE